MNKERSFVFFILVFELLFNIEVFEGVNGSYNGCKRTLIVVKANLVIVYILTVNVK